MSAVIIALFCFLSFFPTLAWSEDSIQKFSLKLNDSSLREVSEMFQEETGYEISFPEAFYSLNISGSYYDISLDKFLSRILKGINYATLVDDDKKSVIVTIYGKSDMGDQITIASQSRHESASRNYEEFEKTVKENEQQYLDYINNPESIDPSSGLTFAQIKDLSEGAEAEIEKMINDPDSLDPSSGRSVSAIKSAAHSGQQELQEFINNPNAVEPNSGLTLRQLSAVESENEKEIKNYLNK